MTGEQQAQQVLKLLHEFAPVQRSRARGLSDSEIRGLETSIGRQLCRGHKAFLRHFGASSKGSLNPFLYDYEFSEHDITEYYSIYDSEEPSEWAFWANVGADPSPYHVFARDINVEDPQIGFPVLNQILYESFWNEIIGSAYYHLIASRSENAGLDGWLWEGRGIPLSGATEPFSVLQQIMVRLGFEPWIEMANAQCLMRRDEMVAWFGRTGSTPHPDDWQLSICGPDPRELSEVREVLADNAGLVRRPDRSI